jgi:hypothetical protein
MPTLNDYRKFVKKYNKEFSLVGISKLTKPKLKKKIEDVLSEQRTEIKEEWKKLHPGEYGQPPAPKKEEPKKKAPKKTAPKKEAPKKTAPKKKTNSQLWKEYFKILSDNKTLLENTDIRKPNQKPRPMFKNSYDFFKNNGDALSSGTSKAQSWLNLLNKKLNEIKKQNQN